MESEVGTPIEYNPDEFVNKNQLNVDILCENRFAKIQK